MCGVFNVNNQKTIVLFLIIFSHALGAMQISPVDLESVKKDVLATTSGGKTVRFFLGEDMAHKEKMLQALKTEYEEVSETTKRLLEQLAQDIEHVQQVIEATKKDSEVHQQDDFYIKKLALLNREYQTLLDTKEIKQQIIEDMKKHIDYLEKYIKSADHADASESLQSVYTFSQLQDLTKKIALDEELLHELYEIKENDSNNLTRNQLYSATKEKELHALDGSLEEIKHTPGDIKRKTSLLDLEKEVLVKEKELEALRMQELSCQIEYVDSKIYVIQDRIKNSRKHLMEMRSRIVVEKSDVLSYDTNTQEIKKEAQNKKTDFIKERTELMTQKNQLYAELEKLSKRFNVDVTNLKNFEQWDIVNQSLSQDYAQYALALAALQVDAVEKKVECVRAEILVEDAKVFYAELLLTSVKTLYAITQSHLQDATQIDKELLYYKEVKQSLLSSVKVYKEKIAQAHHAIKQKHKVIANINRHHDHLHSYQKVRSGFDHKKYEESVENIEAALHKIEEENESLLKLSELYTSYIDLKEESLIVANFIIQELGLIGVWHRSNRAVTLEGIANLIPDFIMFLHNMRGIIGNFFFELGHKNILVQLMLIPFKKIMWTFVMLLIFLLVFAGLLGALPFLYDTVLNLGDFQRPFLNSLQRFIVCLLGFIKDYFLYVYVWTTLLFITMHYEMPVALVLIFYAISMVFLMYMSRVLLRYFLQTNSTYNFCFLSRQYQERFSWIYSLFMTSTIGILFFRSMFMKVMIYQQSEFPTILLRLYHMVIIVSLIFSVDKHELLQLFSEKHKISQMVKAYVDRYFYLLLLFILVMLIMSDPYLGGYGTLVWYIIWNVLVSLLVVAMMYGIHGFVKRYSSLLFFKEDDELGGSKERFDYAKTWYAIFVVLAFMSFVLFTGLLVAKIWGYGITRVQIHTFFDYQLFGIDREGGKQEYLRVINLLRIIAISFSGFIISYVFRKYVLQKIFDIQYVDSGVQDTITTLSRYIIIIAMILGAFAKENLGFLVTYVLGIALLTFGWSFKDMFTDFVAYFFILVQRPIKEGDFIRIDDQTNGVVRKIGPRAVILRKKNVHTIVVPNSVILKSAVSNWNYTKSFTGCDDILFSIPFDADIEVARRVLIKMIDENPDVLKVPQPIVRLEEFSDKGYVILIRVFISSSNTLRQWTIASDVRVGAVKALAQEHIRVAAPVVSVHMHQEK